MSSDPELDLDGVRDVIAALRGDGSFRMKNRHFLQMQERDDAREAMRRFGVVPEKVRSRPAHEDPPDCEALHEGERWAIEVTELVHRPSLKQRLAGNPVHHDWEPRELQDAIAERIAEKDRRVLKGGPYQRFFVVLRTEEAYLDREGVVRALEGFQLATSRITDACLVLPYHPSVDPDSPSGHPVILLRLRRGEAG